MSRRIATLQSSGGRSRSRSSSRSSDDDKHQQGFYVGGGVNSGQQVLGPASSLNGEDIVSQFFNSARAHGAEVLSPEENARLGTRNAMKFASGSRGYRLGDAVQPSEAVEMTNNLETQEVALVMWENGFTVDNGPLREYREMSNNSFLQSIAEGRIPHELIRQYPGKAVDIRMERRHEPFVSKSNPFTGQGQRLGEIVPNIVGAGSVGQKSSSGAKAINTADVDFECVKKAQEEIKLVDNEPVTQLQIRLPSGERIAGRFNHSHTVQDVRTFIVNASPDLAFHPFSLMTTFPSVMISQENSSLKEAGTMNLVESLGLRVWVKFFRIVKGCGGWIGFTKKRYLMDEARIGKFMGEDKFGNRYYEDNSYFMPRNRWVEYPEHVWLEYDASQIPAEWHMWLHHMTDETPVQNPPKQWKWMLDHEECLTLLEKRKFYPYSTTRQKLSLWNSKLKEGQ